MDPLNDPRFPDRPSHPDFWRLMEVATQNDGAAAEGDRNPAEIIDCDERSLMYMLTNRIRFLLQHQQGKVDEAFLAAIYLDAFSLGQKFAERGGHQEI